MVKSVRNHGQMNHIAKHIAKKLQFSACITYNSRNHLCHTDHCHNTTTLIHACDVDGDQCDNLTVHYETYNSTGWLNTTCSLYACVQDVSNDCYDSKLMFQSCTNGDCRNGTTKIHACYTYSDQISQPYDASFAFGLDSIFDIPCLNILFSISDQLRLQRIK